MVSTISMDGVVAQPPRAEEAFVTLVIHDGEAAVEAV